jgi:hypothetical protein
MPEAATVTISDVELVKVGTWAASTGVVTVKPEDLADMVAAQGDPQIDRAPLKLGHTGGLSALGDSEPALGWVSNLRLADDGQTLLGDLTDVPAGIADALQAAYKRRSVEIAWGVKTADGNSYRAVIDGLALLGVQAPAVKGLADIEALYQPKKTAASAGATVELTSALAMWDAPTVPADEEADRLRSAVRWARESVAALAALVGIDGLAAAFASIDAMVPADSRGLLAAAPHHDSVPDAPTSGGAMPADQSISSEDAAKARKLLGLPDDTSDADVQSKLSELSDLIKPAGDDKGSEPDAKPDDATTTEPAALSAETLSAIKAAGFTVVTDAAFETLKTNAEQGAQAHSKLAAQARDQVLDEAQAAGKFGAGEAATKVRTQFSAQLDKDFDGTKAVIDALPQIVPTQPIGHDGGVSHDAFAAADDAAWDQAIGDLFAGEIPTPAKEA